MSSEPLRGRLFLVPVPLDLGSPESVNLDAVLPQRTLSQAAVLTHWICENAKTARAFLKRVNACVPLRVPIAEQHLMELPREAHKQGDHRHDPDVMGLLQAARDGHDMGLVSEAGMPAVADPGSSVVRAAHRLGIQVVPLVGPSSPLLALAASGMNGQCFAFWGYLPIAADERAQAIQRLEGLSRQWGQTQLVIEVPHRNASLFESLVSTLKPDTQLTVASNLTQTTESIQSQRVDQWRGQSAPVGKSQVTMFAIGHWPVNTRSTR